MCFKHSCNNVLTFICQINYELFLHLFTQNKIALFIQKEYYGYLFVIFALAKYPPLNNENLGYL